MSVRQQKKRDEAFDQFRTVIRHLEDHGWMLVIPSGGVEQHRMDVETIRVLAEAYAALPSHPFNPPVPNPKSK